MIGSRYKLPAQSRYCLLYFLVALALSPWLADAGWGQIFWNDTICWQGKSCSAYQQRSANRSVKWRQKRKHAARHRHKKSDAAVARSDGTPSISKSTDERVAIQVDQNDKDVMESALNNVYNIIEYYKTAGKTVAIEVVAYGPGLQMLRADSSPVKKRIAPMVSENPTLSFIACGDTLASQSKSEGKPVTLLSEVKVVPSGVVRLIELQEQGYTYIRP